jgi:hypothetical protein
MLATQQKLLPSADLASRLMTVGRHMMDAQWAYTQALMSANTELFAVWTDRSNAEQQLSERPSIAVKQNEVMVD